jgi:hypothetical protein
MRVATTGCYQGDVAFIRVKKLPSDVVEQPQEGLVIVAHSETGHHHAIAQGEAKLLEKIQRDPLTCYLQIDGEFADVVHHREHDTHETVRLLHGLWEVRRQEEWTPEGMRRVED